MRSTGHYDKAVDTLRECSESWPMLKYYEAYDLGKMGASHEEILKVLKEAENCSTDYCFPNKLEDILVLIDAQKQDPDGANAFYYLGNLWYDKLQYDQAISCWETAAEKKPEFASHGEISPWHITTREKIRKRQRQRWKRQQNLHRTMRESSWSLTSCTGNWKCRSLSDFPAMKRQKRSLCSGMI